MNATMRLNADAVRTSHHDAMTSNPDATIGFVIYYPFQFFVYKNIYEELRSDAEFIIDLGAESLDHANGKLLGDIVAILSRHEARYRILRYEDFLHATYLDRFFSKYTALASVWERGCMNIRATERLKKINVLYGAGKYLTLVRPSRGMYDLVLSYGKPDASLAGLFSRTEIVGNPKFDDWFTDSVDETEVQKIRNCIDTHKRTVLYLPTHSDLSSVDILADDLVAASEHFNVIVKAHYYLTHEEPDRVARLSRGKVLMYDDSTDLLPLLKIADVVVSDNSSAIFDAVLADKPIVVADFWDEDFFDTQHKEMRIYKRGKQGALTYSDSIEQVIKREGKMLTLKNPDDLEEKVEEALRDDEKFKSARAVLREDLFAFNDGKSGKRAAEAIKRCISEPTKPRPIMHHAFEAYKRKMGTLSYGRERALKKKISDYELTLAQKVSEEETGIVFSVVLLSGAKVETSNQYESLRAIAEQKFPMERFEIVVIGQNPQGLEDSILHLRLTGATLPRITGVVEGGELNSSLGQQVANALKQSEGKIICFAADDCILPSDWLLSLSLTYERHPDVGGVGGYVRTAKEAYTIFDEYEYRRLGKRLSVPLRFGFLERFYEVKNQLLEQNPAGALPAMSYKKEFLLDDVSGIQRLSMLERYLKINVMKNAPLCFIPRRVTRMSRLTLSLFWKLNRDRGVTHVLTRDMVDTQDVTERHGFWFALIDSLQAGVQWRQFLPALVMFVGHGAYWVGTLQGALYIRIKGVMMRSREG